MERLGATGPARVTAISTWLDGMGAPELKRMLVTAKIVDQFEKLQHKFANQGAASFSQAHRDVEQTGLSDETWADMSHGQRLDYARQHDQSKFR